VLKKTIKENQLIKLLSRSLKKKKAQVRRSAMKQTINLLIQKEINLKKLKKL
jgi:hypothetical protein